MVRENITMAMGPGGKTWIIGDLMDSFDFSPGKTPNPPLMLSTQIPLSVSATGQQHVVSLRWTLAFDGPETLSTPLPVSLPPPPGVSFNVRRSMVSGGLFGKYELVKNCSGRSFRATECQDRDVTPGTRYYYTITSVSPEHGESPPTAEVNAVAR